MFIGVISGFINIILLEIVRKNKLSVKWLPKILIRFLAKPKNFRPQIDNSNIKPGFTTSNLLEYKKKSKHTGKSL